MNEKAQKKDYVAYFTEWKDSLGASVRKSVPSLEKETTLAAFCSACATVQQADVTRLEAVAARDKADEANHQAADKLVDDATKMEATALKTCQSFAAATLLPCLNATLLSESFDDSALVTFTVLSTATVQHLADWCEHQDAAAVDHLLDVLHNDTALLRACLVAGGARHGRYGPALAIYQQLTNSRHNNNTLPDVVSSPVLTRLALACALELCDPPHLFNGLGTVDPIQRYVHYEQAYLGGELDANFCSLNTWELRQVVNSDATNEELGWGRQALLAYRPDIVLYPDMHWKYCEIVKTDVPYKHPDWYKEPRSYDQILSGGGKCGPRAWYGRFICKAFGIPTWGCQQPGHAAMTRWCGATSEWQVCLGGGWWKSWWEDQGGLDFLLETRARTACGSLQVFGQQVLRMQWVAICLEQEKVGGIRRHGLPDAKAPWYSLSMMQRLELAGADDTTPGSITCNDRKASTTAMEEFDSCVDGRVRLLQQARWQHCNAPETISVTASGIVIPAATCCEPTKDSKKIMFLPSSQGGRQLLVKEDGQAVYCLPEECSKEGGTFLVTLVVATAHRGELPNQICLEGDNDCKTYNLPMPYTMSVWGETDPVRIEILKGTTQISIYRTKQPFGFAFKEIRLVPASDAQLTCPGQSSLVQA